MCLLEWWTGGRLLTDYVGNVLEIMWLSGAAAKSGSRDYEAEVNLQRLNSVKGEACVQEFKFFSKKLADPTTHQPGGHFQGSRRMFDGDKV